MALSVVRPTWKLFPIPHPTVEFFSRARRRLVQGVSGAGTRLSRRHSRRLGILTEDAWLRDSRLYLYSAFKKLSQKTRTSVSKDEDEQRGGDGREPRPHSQQRGR